MNSDITPTTDEQPQNEQQLVPAKPDRAPVRIIADDSGVQAIIPRDLDQVAKLARGIIASGIVPQPFRIDGKRENAPNEPLIIMGILKAMEVGLPPITGLNSLLPINDRFALWGDSVVALAQARNLISDQTRANVGPAIEPKTPLGDYPDEYGVEVRFWRTGQTHPYVGRFTVGDARRANLWMNSNKKPWLMYPDRMLFNRARAFALRDGFADALSGLGIAEEVRDMTPDPIDAGELRSARHAALFSDDDETPQGAVEEGEVEEVPAEPVEAAGEAVAKPGALI